MTPFKVSFLLLALSLGLSSADGSSRVTSARVESCPSCSLNRLPEVKQFIYQDLPQYGVEFKKIHGAPPELVLLDSDDNEVERLPLSKLSRAECNGLLQEKGFSKKENAEL